MGRYALMLKKHAKRVWRRWRKTEAPARATARAPRLRHQDELRVGHAVDPEDSVVGHEPRAFRRLDGLLPDKVPDRRELEIGGENLLGDDVPLVELAHLDLELPFAERLADQVRIRRRDEPLFPLVVPLHSDGHRPGRGPNRSTSL